MRIEKNLNVIYFAALLVSAIFFTFPAYSSSSLDALSFLKKEDVDANADNIDIIGNNVVFTGHVYVRYKDIYLHADKAIVNMSTKDIETTGNCKFFKRAQGESEIDVKDLKKLQEDPDIKVTVEGYVTKPTGRQKLLIKTVTEKAMWQGERLMGNLTSGVFDLGKYTGMVGNYHIEGEKAERGSDGSITITNAKLSTCEYMEEEHEHYSVTASRVRLFPEKDSSNLMERGSKDIGNYNIWAYNCFFNLGDVPVFWVPVLHKPSDETGMGWQIRGGEDSYWGYFIQTKKRFIAWHDPFVETSVLADYYSKRGPGGGLFMKTTSEKTKTEGFIYGLYDKAPEEELPPGRFDIPKSRYDMRLSHLNHLTPRMDFRGRIEKISDINFLEDFFVAHYNKDPQPPTFADLEYQFDHFTASMNLRPRVNTFFSEVERLPEFRIDVPRQELFRNIYYQGESSIGKFKMRWRDYDEARTQGNLIDPEDYKTTRFDTLHMFYYPFELDWLNVLPRAGFRLTYYSDTSKQKVKPGDLAAIFSVDNPSGTESTGNVVNYDDNSDEKLRFAGETGLELNTKLYRTWNEVKNAFWEVDGLRHVAVPYVNYNFIPHPSVSRDKIFYYDDTDRINTQNFTRLGVKNRLQTRRGDYNKQDIYTWASLENYFDYHFFRERDMDEEKFKNLGDFGTIFAFTPFPDFKLTSELLLDSGNTFKINKYLAGFTYDITDRWKISANYNYQGNFDQRSVYSMGSSLTDITGGSSFIRRYGKSHLISGTLEFPITEKTRGETEMTYNILNHRITDSKIKIIRTLHCWELAFEYGLKQRNNGKNNKENKQTFSFMLYLTAAPSARITARQSRTSGGDKD